MRHHLSTALVKSLSVVPLARWLESATAGFLTLAFFVTASVPVAAHANPTTSSSGSRSLSQSSETTNIVTILNGFALYANDWNGGVGDFSILIPTEFNNGFQVYGTLKPIPLDGSPVFQWATMSFDMGDGVVREYYIDFLSRNQDFIDDNLTVTAGSIGTSQSATLLNYGGNTLGIGAANMPVYTINSAVPEPGTLPLIAAGALGVAGLAARRKKREYRSTKE